MDTDFFWKTLQNNGFSFISGVPCSILKAALNNINSDICYIPAVREDSALGLCSGAFLAGKQSAVLMQNSGLGNIVNPLISFNLIYHVQVLLIITWRGEPGKVDAPEHTIMGGLTQPILKTLKIPYKIIDDHFANQVKWANEIMEKENIPVALILREGVFK